MSTTGFVKWFNKEKGEAKEQSMKTIGLIGGMSWKP